MTLTQELLRETASKHVRAEAANLRTWADQSHPNPDAAERFAKEHHPGEERNADNFRKRCDDLINDQRWASIVRLCAQHGLELPEGRAA